MLRMGNFDKKINKFLEKTNKLKEEAKMITGSRRLAIIPNIETMRT